MARKAYDVLVGINYLPNGKGTKEKRAEPGELVDDLPPGVIDVWLEQSVIGEHKPKETGDA